MTNKQKKTAKPRRKPKQLAAANTTESQALVVQQQPRPLPTRQRAGLLAEYSREQIDLMKQTVAKDANDLEFLWFINVAKEVGLSPLRRQIYCIKRWSNKDGKYITTHQTGIDGFRAIADRTGNYAPSDRKPEFVYDDNKRLFSCTVWVKKFIPKDRSWHEYPATALWDEYVPMEKRDGKDYVPFMWQKMPHAQLEKTTEAKALRRGFPGELANLYVHEEMHRADIESGRGLGPDGEQAVIQNDGATVITHEFLEQQKRERERGTLEPGKEENRGHGDEGFVDQGPKPGTRAVSPEQKKQEDKAAERAAKLETLETRCERVEPKSKKLTPQQINDNKKAKAQGKEEPHQPQTFFIAHCAGDIPVYAWDKHTFRAILGAERKDVVWRVERRKTDDGKKEFLSLVQIEKQGGVRFIVDPATKDWIPEASARTEAPSVPDQGESAPQQTNVVDNSVESSEKLSPEGAESVFS